jgi:hypothetical protein
MNVTEVGGDNELLLSGFDVPSLIIKKLAVSGN